MWRNEVGLVEMLFTYIGEYNEFESYSNWRPVLVDILASHEEIRRQRLEFANEFVNDGPTDEEKAEFERLEEMRSYEHAQAWIGDMSSYDDDFGDKSYEYASALSANAETNDGNISSGVVAKGDVDTPEDLQKPIKQETLDESETAPSNVQVYGSQSSLVVFSSPEFNPGGALAQESPNKSSAIAETPQAATASITKVRRNKNDRRHHCTICGRSFKRSTHLKRHMNMHSGRRPFACNLCRKSFTRNEHLKSHLQMHIDVGSFPCKKCDKSFLHSDQLKRHMVTHTGPRSFPCDMCDKKFAHQGHLKLHQVIHNRNR